MCAGANLLGRHRLRGVRTDLNTISRNGPARMTRIRRSTCRARCLRSGAAQCRGDRPIACRRSGPRCSPVSGIRKPQGEHGALRHCIDGSENAHPPRRTGAAALRSVPRPHRRSCVIADHQRQPVWVRLYIADSIRWTDDPQINGQIILLDDIRGRNTCRRNRAFCDEGFCQHTCCNLRRTPFLEPNWEMALIVTALLALRTRTPL